MAQFRPHAILPLGLALAALAGAGCGSEETRPSAPPAAAPAPSAPPEAAAPAPPAPVAEVTPPAPTAAVPEWQGELPSDFPSDVQPHPGAKVTSARGTVEAGAVVNFDSRDSVDVVAKYYADSLAATGWQTETREGEDGVMVLGDKEGRVLRVLIREGGEGTLVDMIIGPAE